MLSENRRYQIQVLCLRPLLFGAAAVALWWFVLWPNGIHAHPNDKTMGENFEFYTTFHALLASFFFYKMWDDRQKLRECIAKKDEEGFRSVREDTLPFAQVIMLTVLSFYIIAASLFKDYGGIVEGLNGVFSNTFIIMLFWEMAKNFRDPVTAPWNKRFVKDIPPEWLLPRPNGDGC